MLMLVFIALALGFAPGVILPGSAQSVSEPPTVNGVPVNQSETAPTRLQLTYYSFGGGETICLVEDQVLLQPATTPNLGGQFFVQGLDQTLFRVSSLVQRCQSADGVGVVDCDQVWIEGLTTLLERGSFWVIYQPAGGGSQVFTLVRYGPPGITYQGIVPEDGPVLIPTTNEGITFELRVANLAVGTETVCESVDGGQFKESKLLRATFMPALECVEAIVLAGRSTSLPFIINVSLMNLSRAGELTPRVIAVSFPRPDEGDQGNEDGVCDLAAVPSSELLSVTGAGREITTTGAVAPDTTSAPPATGTTVSDAMPDSTTPRLTDSTGTGDLIGTTDESTTSSTPFRTPSTPSTADTDETAALSTIIPTVVLSVVALIVAMVLLVVWCIRGHRRKAKHDVEKNGQEVSNAVQSNGTVQSDGHAQTASPLVRDRDVVDSGIVVDHPNHLTSSADSRSTVALTAAPCTTELHRQTPPTPTAQTPPTNPTGRVQNVGVSNILAQTPPGVGTPRRLRGGSGCSETESEGSEVALLKEIAGHTGKMVKELKDMNKASSQNFKQLNQQSGEIADGVFYIVEHTDRTNLSNSSS